MNFPKSVSSIGFTLNTDIGVIGEGEQYPPHTLSKPKIYLSLNKKA